MIVVYYHTSAEYATDYNLIIQNLLEGYDPGTEETLVVTSGDSIIAANREGLAGQNVDDVPVLRSIRENAHGGEMTACGPVSATASGSTACWSAGGTTTSTPTCR